MDNHLTFILRLATFAMLHSIFALPNVKDRVMRLTALSPATYRFGYNIMSLLAFGWVMAVERNSAMLYEISGVVRYVFYLMQALLLAALASCLKSTGLVSFLGLDAFRGKSANKIPQQLATSGWYGIVRHPLYFLSILFLFLNPVMSVR